jgi:Kef-type K+ transport system membrane component KefB
MIRYILASLLFPAALAAVAGGSDSTEPVARVALALTVILLTAKLGEHLAVRVGQPGVLGELLAGIILGNLGVIGFSGLEYVKTDPFVDVIAQIGVIVLLFHAGLESTVAQMMKVGVSSALVAVLGVIAPGVLGWGVGAWLLPQAGAYAHLFLGATLCATSVGITARVLQDLDRARSREARIILGAAVIDDVLGLVILAVVTGAITAANGGGTTSVGAVAWILAKAAIFLVGALFLGLRVSPWLFSLASKLRARSALLVAGLSFCFILSWLAGRIGLAPIVGAFAAGLILEDAHYRDFVKRGEPSLDHLIQPLAAFLVPVFFVVMGMRTDLRSFVHPGVFGLAIAITVAAILGKQICSLGVVTKGVDRLSVGIGMVPRGEVGLIFANVGLTLTLDGQRIISPTTFSAVVIMVIITTMLTPPALKWSLLRRQTAADE